MTALPRFYPILDVESWTRRGVNPLDAAGAMLAGGARILQWRSKAPLTRAGLDDVERVASLCRDAGAAFVVNDRADVAMLVNAGLHVGQDDLPPQAARRLIGDQAMLGFSTHNAEQLRAAAAGGFRLDYAALGPIFATSSKENPDPVVGCERLRQWRSLSPWPLVAIGGIARGNAKEVLAAGADSVAVISDLVPDPCTPTAIARRVEEWLQLVNR
jgi:thiamine-phosphate pyrophosphorylase